MDHSVIKFWPDHAKRLIKRAVELHWQPPVDEAKGANFQVTLDFLPY
jgi:hypothetical protein